MNGEKNTGRFITLEGAEGVGKSTLLPVLKELLIAQGVEVVATREPGGTPLGEQLREVVLETEEPMVAKAELLLMFASRAQHMESIIVPALNRGAWVLCDRFTDASYAYQGAGRMLGSERVEVIESWVQEGLQPDLTLLLDASRETSLARTQRRRSLDRIESEGDDFFDRVRQGYLVQARKHPQRIRRIDANPKFEQVCQTMREVVLTVIGPWLEQTVSR